MVALQVELPDEVAEKLTEFATRQNLPAEQFAASALTEFVEAMAGEDYFRQH